MLPFIVVTCSLWVCAPTPLQEVSTIEECIQVAARHDNALPEVLKEIDVRIVCMSREQYKLTAKLPPQPK